MIHRREIMVVTTVWVGSGQLVKHAYIEKKKKDSNRLHNFSFSFNHGGNGTDDWY